MRVSYPKDMRDQAKRERKHLITLAVPGLIIQAPVDTADVKEIMAFVNTFLEKRSGR